MKSGTLNNSNAGLRSESVRVLFFAKRITGGGAERIITTLVRRISRSQFEPHLATFGVDAYAEDIPKDVVIHQLTGSELRWAILKIASLVKTVRPQVILSTMVETNTAVLLAQPFFPHGTKVVLREASNPSHLLAHMLPYPFVWKQVYRHLYPRADAIVCQSRSMQNDILSHIPIATKRTTQIYNGVDARLVQQRAMGPNPFKTAGPNLVAAGRLSAEKNFAMLLDVLPIVQKRFPSTRLTILGSGPEQASLKQKAQALGIEHAIDFAGFQENPFPYYHYADLYLQTSIFEGLSNVLLEVSSLGTPSVATLAGGSTSEIAEVAGTIRLVKEGGEKTFAEAVVTSLREPHPVLRREEFLRIFGVECMIAKYESLLARVVRESSDPAIQSQSGGGV